MLLKSLTVAMLSATFIISIPSTEARAGNGGAIAGGLAAGAVAGFIAHKVYKNRQRNKRSRRYYSNRRSYTKRRSYSNRRRVAYSQSVLDSQTRLNTLGYNAGRPDGLKGRRTRAAIRQFQVANGFPSTGRLTNPQIVLLSQLTTPTTAGLQQSNQALLSSRTIQPQYAQPVQPQIVQPQIVPTAPIQPQIVQPQVIRPVAPVIQAAPVQPAPIIQVQQAPYSTLKDRPTVLGIKVGGSFATVPSALAQEGFSNCETFPNATFCERETSFGTDKIAVASSGGKIHTLTRKLSFNTPTTRDSVFSPMPVSYQPLIKSQNHTVSSSPACSALISAKSDTFDSMVKQSVNGNSFDASSVGFSHACSYYFAVNMAGESTINEVELTFFDAKPILEALSGVTTNASASTGTSQLKF